MHMQMLPINIYIAPCVQKQACGWMWDDISDCFYCLEMSRSTNQMDARGHRKSSSLTWAQSGQSPQSNRLAPTAPKNVPFCPVLMNPEGKKMWMGVEFSVESVAISCNRSITLSSLFAPYTKLNLEFLMVTFNIQQNAH